MAGPKLRELYNSSFSQLLLNLSVYAVSSLTKKSSPSTTRATARSPPFSTPAAMASNTASPQSMPDFIAVCEPLILAKFRKPASSPIKEPPGKVNFGSELKPPLVTARAPRSEEHTTELQSRETL